VYRRLSCEGERNPALSSIARLWHGLDPVQPLVHPPVRAIGICSRDRSFRNPIEICLSAIGTLSSVRYTRAVRDAESTAGADGEASATPIGLPSSVSVTHLTSPFKVLRGAQIIRPLIKRRGFLNRAFIKRSIMSCSLRAFVHRCVNVPQPYPRSLRKTSPY